MRWCIIFLGEGSFVIIESYLNKEVDVSKRIILLIAIAITSQAFAVDSMHSYQSAKILSKRNVSGVGAVLSLRIPKNIPLKYWVVCDYYDKDSEIVASINHV